MTKLALMNEFMTEMAGARMFMQLHAGEKMSQHLPQMDIFDNFVSSGNKLMKRIQILTPVVAGLLLIGCAALYAWSDQYSQKAKSWGIKILFSAIIVEGVTSVVGYVTKNFRI